MFLKKDLNSFGDFSSKRDSKIETILCNKFFGKVTFGDGVQSLEIPGSLKEVSLNFVERIVLKVKYYFVKTIVCKIKYHFVITCILFMSEMRVLKNQSL